MKLSRRFRQKISVTRLHSLAAETHLEIFKYALLGAARGKTPALVKALRGQQPFYDLPFAKAPPVFEGLAKSCCQTLQNLRSQES